ncbi:hypothetical protein ACFOHS_16365 [Jhaorihella thermophila]
MSEEIGFESCLARSAASSATPETGETTKIAAAISRDKRDMANFGSETVATSLAAGSGP